MSSDTTLYPHDGERFSVSFQEHATFSYIKFELSLSCPHNCEVGHAEHVYSDSSVGLRIRTREQAETLMESLPEIASVLKHAAQNFPSEGEKS